MRALSTTAATLLLAGSLMCSAVGAQVGLEIAWSNDLLTVRAADASLADVLGELARIAGMEVVGRERLSGRVSADFANLPLKEGIAKLLGDANYLVQERPGGRDGAPRVILTINSMASAAIASGLSGPIYVPALEALISDEAEDAAHDLENELDDPDTAEDLREEADEVQRFLTAGAFGSTATVDSLVRLISYANDGVRIEALKALTSRPSSSVMRLALPVLVAGLGDGSWDVRSAVVELLGHASDRASLHAMGPALEKGERDVQISALRALAMRADAESVPYLRSVLEDRDATIRSLAGSVLAELDRRERERAKPAGGR